MADCSPLLAETASLLAVFDGTGESLLDDEHIVFNSRYPAAVEPFELARVEYDR